jgi:hypothetical protein
MSKVLAHTAKEDFPVPDGVTVVLVDEDPSGECLRPVPMAFIVGTEPAVTCAGLGQRRERSPQAQAGAGLGALPHPQTP